MALNYHYTQNAAKINLSVKAAVALIMTMVNAILRTPAYQRNGDATETGMEQTVRMAVMRWIVVSTAPEM